MHHSLAFIVDSSFLFCKVNENLRLFIGFGGNIPDSLDV